jgi:hypothetical protein
MKTMKNARLSAPVEPIKTPAFTHHSEKEIEHEGDFIGCGHSRGISLSGDGATRAPPERPGAEHPERRARFRRLLRD